MQYSIVFSSEIRKTFDLRIDAEYWRSSFIKNSHLVSKNKTMKDFIIQDIPNIKSSPINKNFEYLEISKISLRSLAYETIQIHEGEEPERAHHILKKNDIVVSTVRPNRNAVALINRNGIIGSSGLTVLRVKNIEPEYLFAFCKTNYFINCLMRANKATMYPAVSNKDVLEVPLFISSKSFREKIKQNIQKSVSYIAQSKEKFEQAQSFLLSELGLTGWKPKHQLSFVKQYSDVEKSGRMDAEHFQPKYEEIIKAIKRYKGGWNTLGKLGYFVNGSFIPDKHYSDSGKKFYIRIKELSLDIPFEKEKMVYINNDFVANNETVVKENDFVFATIGATIGKVNLITKELSGSYPSNNTSKFTLNQVKNPFYFECLLRSLLVQEQIKQRLTQTTQEKILNNDLGKIIIPLLLRKVQDQIQRKIFESFNFYTKSKYLLKCAKRAIEKAIEKDEKTASHWLKDKLSKDR